MIIRKLAITSALVCLVTVSVPSARAAQHFWALTEVYSNSSGTLQFIEMFDAFGGQNFVNGFQVRATNLANTQTNTFTITTGDLAGNTFNQSLLFGTAGIQAAGGPQPDYILPNNFLFTDGGTLNFFGLNSAPYTALPLDGLMSRNWANGLDNPINSPINYGGQMGVVNGVPEPSTVILSSLAVSAFGLFRTRRRATEPIAVAS